MVPHKDQHHRTVHLGEVVGEQPQGGIRVVQPHDQRDKWLLQLDL